ncbi:MAG: Flp pilus assembly protein CpaB [Planctomycetaceae bacterium]|nr:Flp pilus assembly protein CpaB [Planctomycetaceae bacterium]
MKLTPWMMTVAAFAVVAVLAVGFLLKKLTAREVVEEAKPEVRTLPMALTDIEPGTILTEKNVGLGPWSDEDSLTADTFTTRDSVIGRIAREPITRATPLKGADFYPPNQFPPLGVREGMRAVTVKLGDNTSVLNGRIKPDDYVDVHMTINASVTPATVRQSGVDDAVTLTLFEGVRVLAVNDPYGRQGGVDENNVTLELDKDQARIILLAEDKGNIALTYNPNGQGAVTRQGLNSDADRITLEQLLGITPPPEKQKPYMTEQYRHGARGTLHFQDGRRVGFDGDSNGDQGTPVHQGDVDGGGYWQTNRTSPRAGSVRSAAGTPSTTGNANGAI